MWIGVAIPGEYGRVTQQPSCRNRTSRRVGSAVKDLTTLGSIDDVRFATLLEKDNIHGDSGFSEMHRIFSHRSLLIAGFHIAEEVNQT